MEKIKEKYFYPMSVSAVAGSEDTSEDVILRWDRFDLLSEGEKNILISNNVPTAIRKIAMQFNLAPVMAAEISRLVRDVYFGAVSKSNLSHELIRKIQSLSVEDSQKIARILDMDIFTLVLQSREEVESEKRKEAFVQLPIREALLQYPKLSEQSITNSQLKLHYSPAPVRPSIKNWITDFHDAMGSMKHSPMDRGNFLFHGENGKTLTAVERQKLGTILKSLDEKTLLTIDPDAQLVVFENIQQAPETVRAQVASPIRTVLPAFNLRENENVEQRPTQREVLPNIDLRQTAPASVSFAAEVERKSNYVEPAFARKDFNATPKQPEEKVQDFSAKPAAESVSRILPPSNSAIESMIAQPKPLAIGSGDDYFSIPSSKPPIGSESFHPKSAPIIKDEKLEESASEEKKGVAASFLGKMGFGLSPKAETADKKILQNPATQTNVVEKQQNPDLMSDEMLYEMLQKKKAKITVPAQGAMSFSSPQKLPAEQVVKKQVTSPVAAQVQLQQTRPILRPAQIANPVAAQKQGSPYHIAPSRHLQEEKNDLVKNKKNIVDLKN